MEVCGQLFFLPAGTPVSFPVAGRVDSGYVVTELPPPPFSEHLARPVTYLWAPSGDVPAPDPNSPFVSSCLMLWQDV